MVRNWRASSALAALAEDGLDFPAPTGCPRDTCNSSSRGSNSFLWVSFAGTRHTWVHTHTCRQNTHICKVKWINLLEKLKNIPMDSKGQYSSFTIFNAMERREPGWWLKVGRELKEAVLEMFFPLSLKCYLVTIVLVHKDYHKSLVYSKY